MAKENSAGLGVSTRYGPVTVPDGARGSFHSQDGLQHIVADWSADLLRNGSINQAITIVLKSGKIVGGKGRFVVECLKV
jgi:hypothetical protein